MKRFLIPLLTLVILATGLGRPVTSGHIDAQSLLTLDTMDSASVVETSQIYEDTTTFLSEVYETEPFHLLGINWSEDISEQSFASLTIRFRKNGTWSDWQKVNKDEDGASNDDSLSSYFVTEGNAFQYRAFLSSEDSSVTPSLKDISFDYINGGRKSIKDSFSKLVFRNSDKYVERDEWGADESLRYLPDDWEAEDVYADLASEEADEDEDYPELKIERTITKENGNLLGWPLEYPEDVKKIVIHHTATTDDLNNPEAAIRAIYHYHASTKGWMDIGYNYIIAPDGTVFQGRAGDDGVVAAHAAGFNTASVGIALLGNYVEKPIPGEMMQSLTDLVYEKAKIHGIDPDSSGKFRGEVIPNILGHRDLSATACPGEVTYDYLDGIRDIVGASLDNRRHKNFDDEFSYDDIGAQDLFTLNPQDEQGVNFRIRNSGTATWNDETFLTTIANSEADEIVSIEKDENKVVSMLKEEEVVPGDVGTFSFKIASGMNGGLAHFDVKPVFNGDESSSHLMDLGVFVEQPYVTFKTTNVDKPDLLKPGETAEVSITIMNTGNLTWQAGDEFPMSLNRSGTSKIYSKSKIGSISKDVEPGETATFEFEITAPSTGGRYSLYYTPEIENSNAIIDASGTLTVEVLGSDEDIMILDEYDDLNFMPGETHFSWIQIMNSSKETWNREDFSLAFESSELEIGDIRMPVMSLKSGQSTKIYFDITAPDEEGEYTLEIRPQLEGQNLSDNPYEMIITVGEEEFEAEEYEDPIRIRLTPDDGIGAPVITSGHPFAVYEGDELVATFSANKRVRVTPSGNKYILTSGWDNWELDDPIRFVPTENKIMKILSLKQVAAWDSSINDNKFRGTIEIRKVDGENIFINELSLEDYIRGLAEETNTTPREKLKAMSILARSYAYFYMTQGEKFPGMPYTLEDDPNTSQKYLGYGYEQRHPLVAAAAIETAGQVVTYNGEVIKTPYFSRSDGRQTKSAQEVWGWTNTPYLMPVDDSHCDSDEFWGHGVGLSGCGAKALSQQGLDFEEIIKYYYTGVEIDEI